MTMLRKKKIWVFVASFILVVLVLGAYQIFFRANQFDSGAPLLASAAKDGRIELVDDGLDVNNLPDGWLHRTFFNITPTEYTVVNVDERVALHCSTDNSGSILARDMLINLADFPTLKWQWKIDKPLVSDIDEETKDGDDHPARFFVMFKDAEGDRKAAEIIWSNERFKAGDYKIINGFYHLVANGLQENVGKWHDQTIDLEKLYRKIGGEGTDVNIGLLGFFCDSDNTGGSTSAYFADVHLEAGVNR